MRSDTWPPFDHYISIWGVFANSNWHGHIRCQIFNGIEGNSLMFFLLLILSHAPWDINNKKAGIKYFDVLIYHVIGSTTFSRYEARGCYYIFQTHARLREAVEWNSSFLMVLTPQLSIRKHIRIYRTTHQYNLWIVSAFKVCTCLLHFAAEIYVFHVPFDFDDNNSNVLCMPIHKMLL